MKYFLRLSLLIFVASTGFASCKKYLDVQPVDQLLSQQVFANVSTMEGALNGIYVSMATEPLYGADLGPTALDVMAQYYNLADPSKTYTTLANYNYTDAAVEATFTNVWTTAYAAVLNLNQFLQALPASASLLPPDQTNILLGECHGLRAYILFDLLRIFGPVYAADSTQMSIPYPATPTIKAAPILPANIALDSILSDLRQAGALLSHDPVIAGGPLPIGGSDSAGDNFFLSRNKRMNYFAVNALMARVLLYRGDKPNALKAATAVITQASPWFPWSPAALSLPSVASPDRIFSSEVIFGLENVNQALLQTEYFTGATAANLLIPAKDVLDGIYESNQNDYRYRSSWFENTGSDVVGKEFFKYKPTDPSSPAYNLQPMIRMSELYDIAAECEPDPARATAWLNAVRFNRGLPDLAGNIDLADEITKEVQKEFWGEGQLFFYYKRLAFPAINNGAYNNPMNMGPAQYVVPLPLNETQYR